MLLLFFQAYFQLIFFDVLVALGNFRALHDKVHAYPLASRKPAPNTAERLSTAMDLACICYWKHVLCLQRSAATTCLFRRYGIPAQMVIGAHLLPFRAHAWVEADGGVVNDKPYMQEIYAEMDRC